MAAGRWRCLRAVRWCRHRLLPRKPDAVAGTGDRGRWLGIVIATIGHGVHLHGARKSVVRSAAGQAFAVHQVVVALDRHGEHQRPVLKAQIRMLAKPSVGWISHGERVTLAGTAGKQDCRWGRWSSRPAEAPGRRRTGTWHPPSRFLGARPSEGGRLALPRAARRGLSCTCLSPEPRGLSARGRARRPPSEFAPNNQSINRLRGLFHAREGRMPSLQKARPSPMVGRAGYSASGATRTMLALGPSSTMKR